MAEKPNTNEYAARAEYAEKAGDAEKLGGHDSRYFAVARSLKEYRAVSNDGTTFNTMLKSISEDVAPFSFWNNPTDNPFSFPSGAGIAIRSTLLHGAKGFVLFATDYPDAQTLETKRFITT